MNIRYTLFCLLIHLHTLLAFGQSSVCSTYMQQALKLEDKGTYNQAIAMRSLANACPLPLDSLVLNNSCIAYDCAMLGEIAQMKPYLDTALLLSQRYQIDSLGEIYADLHDYLGYYYHYKGRLSDAVAAYKKSLTAEKHLVQVQFNTNWKEQFTNHPDKLLPIYLPSPALIPCFNYLSLQINDKSEELATATHNLAYLYSQIGAYQEAINQYLTALPYYSNPIEKADTYHAIALAYQKMGQFKASQNYYIQAVDIYTAVNNKERELAQAYSDLSGLFIKQKRLKEAKEILNKMSILLPQVAPKIISSYHLNVGYIFAENEQIDTASWHFKQAINFRAQKDGKSIALANALKRTGLSLHANQNQHRQALDYYQQAIAQVVLDFEYRAGNYSNPTLEKINDRLVLLELLGCKAQSLEALGEMERAEETLQLAIQLIDRIRFNYLSAGSKFILLEKATPIFEQAIRIAIAEEDWDTMFETMERSKATVLLEKTNTAAAFYQIPKRVLEEEQGFKEEIAYLERQVYMANNASYLEQQLLQLKTRYTDSLDVWRAQFPDYYAAKYNINYPTIAAVQDKIVDEETAIVEYFVGETAVYALAITKGQILPFQFPKAADFEAQLQELRAIISTADSEQQPNQFEDFAHLAHSVYENYLSAILAALPASVHNLIIAPDRELSFIPFQTLVQYPLAAAAEQSRFDTLSYLVEDYNIGYIFSSTVLLNDTAAAPRKNLKVGAFAPIFEDQALAYVRGDGYGKLKHSQAEVETIKTLWNNAVLYLTTNASKDMFHQKAYLFDILHLSTHAEVDPNNLEQSKIYFYDDYLTLGEICNLKLEAALTVLSACETGVGKYQQGEGMLSLARGFVLAGCPSLVTSLWKVPDGATSDLMIDFHRALRKGQSVSGALQSAQLTYLNDSNNGKDRFHPFYWAAFIQMGDAAPLVEKGINIWILLGVGLLSFLLLIALRKQRVQN